MLKREKSICQRGQVFYSFADDGKNGSQQVVNTRDIDQLVKANVRAAILDDRLTGV